ncbi:Nif3-like dinuclear metal center hexameric protein [Candidatus Thiodictyon syntrophicum]|jgi:dinuclear metal center YbgI/SA1388 family protein|uniref:Nif3-like dinuclear metal center hexameric protein n=1 Tax=Candidatus Thiodictyon syntrophicum TaxID=1166950 RepID=A0A2K8U815_9GAMM|nr:Nif3-like dinuclear metal center hexameric protein [Candidatus Thiodictyon syntrophicum]AUB81549.1 Nif3-like dinuclear metal center hexameric protein [Candidatus Thiodictyon syntrophicum]
MIEPLALSAYCDRLLDSAACTDYAPNGLQVEGERPIRRLVSGVTASLALIAAALELQADALLVHHGWFWKGENPCLTGLKGRRVRALIQGGASLIAYHLPLDTHPTLGNNAALASQLGILDAQATGIGNGVLWTGRLGTPMAPADWAAAVGARLGRSGTLVVGSDRPVQHLAWCTGGGQGYIEAAAALGVEAFLSGEISEQTTHAARELGIAYLAAGHHATERYGVQALGDHLARHFALDHRYVEIDNPA